MLSSDVIQAVKAAMAGIFVNSYILNNQDLQTIRKGNMPRIPGNNYWQAPNP